MTENMTLARIEYPKVTTVWRTPKGHEAVLNIREGTTDWNTVNSIMTADEYGLKELTMTGLALDVGAHIGAWAIAAALDNPELRVLAIEAIGENAELAAENAYLSGVGDRVEVVHNAAAAPGVETADVFWRAQGTESFEHHAFIGNSSLVYDHGDTNHETETVACVALGDVIRGAHESGEELSFIKIDCEGCEWGFLTDPAIQYVEGIIGEWHPTGGHTGADIVALLVDTHDVTLSGPVEGPGGFVAVRRA